MNAAATPELVPAPKGWLRLALLGAFVYLASRLMAFYPVAASQATRISLASLGPYFPVFASTGLVLFLWGLVAAFWRLNRAAGHTAAGVTGLVVGALGVFVLGALAVLDLVVAFGLQVPLLAAIGSREALTDVLGTFFAFVGLATLGVGLAHAGGLFQTSPPPMAGVQEASDLRYY